MHWQSRLEKTAIALNLIGLGFGFCILGILILAKGAPADGSWWMNGSLGMIVGALFLLFVVYFCKHSAVSDSRNARQPPLQSWPGSSRGLIVETNDRAAHVHEVRAFQA